MFIIYLIGILGYSAAKPIWYDELSTVYITRLNSLGDIWTHLQISADNNPPGLHYLIWLTRQVIPNELVALRLPSMLGYFLMCVCLYRFVARRLGTAAGLVAGLFPTVTLAQKFAFEGRPYALMIGFSALALVAWQESRSERWRKLALIGLALSISFALLSHYYAAPFLLVLAGGELVRIWETKKFDLWVWLSLGLGAASLFLCWPLLQHTRQLAGLVVSEPVILANAYFFYLQIFDNFRLSLFIGPLVVLSILSAAGYRLSQTTVGASTPAKLPWAEIAAALLLTGYSFYIWGVAVFVTKAYNIRYALPSIAGLALLVAYGLALASRATPYLTQIAVALLGGLFVLGSAQASLALTYPPANGLNNYPLLSQATGSDLIVLPNHETYLQIYYYSPESLRNRIVYLTNSQLTQKSIDDLLLEGIQHIEPLTIEPLPQFIQTHHHFWLYQRDILPLALQDILAQRGSLLLVGQSQTETLYQVQMP